MFFFADSQSSHTHISSLFFTLLSTITRPSVTFFCSSCPSSMLHHSRLTVGRCSCKPPPLHLLLLLLLSLFWVTLGQIWILSLSSSTAITSTYCVTKTSNCKTLCPPHRLISSSQIFCLSVFPFSPSLPSVSPSSPSFPHPLQCDSLC